MSRIICNNMANLIEDIQVSESRDYLAAMFSANDPNFEALCDDLACAASYQPTNDDWADYDHYLMGELEKEKQKMDIANLRFHAAYIEDITNGF